MSIENVEKLLAAKAEKIAKSRLISFKCEDPDGPTQEVAAYFNSRGDVIKARKVLIDYIPVLWGDEVTAMLKAPPPQGHKLCVMRRHKSGSWYAIQVLYP